jgi:hypothetical protein
MSPSACRLRRRSMLVGMLRLVARPRARSSLSMTTKRRVIRSDSGRIRWQGPGPRPEAAAGIASHERTTGDSQCHTPLCHPEGASATEGSPVAPCGRFPRDKPGWGKSRCEVAPSRPDSSSLAGLAPQNDKLETVGPRDDAGSALRLTPSGNAARGVGMLPMNAEVTTSGARSRSCRSSPPLDAEADR